MTDPYKVLGVSPSATNDEVKSAYRTLAKKYHPDHYADSPLGELAVEKMKEINEAYDTIMDERKGKRKSNPYESNGGYNGYNSSSYAGSSRSSNYTDVRNLISTGRISDAEQILNGVPSSSRDAEWNFLKGTCFYRRGWVNEAYNHIQTACRMDPGNREYSAALNGINRQRSGNYGGYNTSRPVGGTSTCDCCSSLICADCCCECLGGDLIACC